MAKHSDLKNKAKSNDWERLKKFGVTGVLRVILSVAGAFVLTILILYGTLYLLYEKEGFILFTNNFWYEEIAYMVLLLQIFIIFFIALSFLEQGIRKLLHSKVSERFAEKSFEMLMDIGDEDYSDPDSKNYIREQLGSKTEATKAAEHERELELKTSNKSKAGDTVKGISIILVILIVVNGVNLYLYATGRTAVYNDRIVKNSALNSIGDTYTYDDIKEYFLEEEDNYPLLKLVTKKNKKIKISADAYSIIEVADNIESEEDALIKLDTILKSHNVKKTINCKISDFEYMYDDVKKLKPLFKK